LRFPVNPTICKSITTIDRATRGARTHARIHTHTLHLTGWDERQMAA
jgi:hypothetical protein